MKFKADGSVTFALFLRRTSQSRALKLPTARRFPGVAHFPTLHSLLATPRHSSLLPQLIRASKPDPQTSLSLATPHPTARHLAPCLSINQASGWISRSHIRSVPRLQQQHTHSSNPSRSGSGAASPRRLAVTSPSPTISSYSNTATARLANAIIHLPAPPIAALALDDTPAAAPNPGQAIPD